MSYWDNTANFIRILDEIDKAKFYKSDKVALARVLLVAALTNAERWHYDYQWHSYNLRWKWRCNGEEVEYHYMLSEEILIDFNGGTMRMAEMIEHTCLDEWLRYRYHGPRE